MAHKARRKKVGGPLLLRERKLKRLVQHTNLEDPIVFEDKYRGKEGLGEGGRL